MEGDWIENSNLRFDFRARRSLAIMTTVVYLLSIAGNSLRKFGSLANCRSLPVENENRNGDKKGDAPQDCRRQFETVLVLDLRVHF